jgi:ribosomal-protein-alanine N-acetyltransferase
MQYSDLTTERLFLRELRLDDAEEIFRLRSNQDVNALIDRPSVVTIDDAIEFIKKIKTLAANREVIMWVITLMGEAKLIGTILYWHIEWENRKAEIGYELLPEYWGKGIMAETLRKVIGFGFEQLKFKKITADPKTNNKKSIRLLEKLGFEKTGETGDGYLIYELHAG